MLRAHLPRPPQLRVPHVEIVVGGVAERDLEGLQRLEGNLRRTVSRDNPIDLGAIAPPA